jgi:hypothetical protein
MSETTENKHWAISTFHYVNDEGDYIANSTRWSSDNGTQFRMDLLENGNEHTVSLDIGHEIESITITTNGGKGIEIVLTQDDLDWIERINDNRKTR